MTQQELEFLNNLQPFNCIEDIPSIPPAQNEEEHKVIIDNLLRCGAIPKNKLIWHRRYKGKCRNATEAIWDGEYFEYITKDCGQTYLEKIKHFEDEYVYDAFVPLYGLIKDN
jgi:hypothetical protein